MATINAWNNNGTLRPSDGGTGANSLTAHGILIGEGTSAVSTINPTTAGNILLGTTGSDPTFVAPTQSGLVVTTNATTLNYALPSPIPVASGGTGVTSVATNTVVTGGTTSTGALQAVAVGAQGTILTSNGSSALPSFNTPGNGLGNLIFIQTINAAGLTACNFVNNFNTANYLVLISALTPSSGTATLNMNFSINGGTSWASTGYTAGNNSCPVSGTFTYTNANSTTTCPIGRANAESTSGNSVYSGVFYFYNFLTGTAVYTGIFQSGVINGGIGYLGQAYGTFGNAVSGIQFVLSTGVAFSSGTISLYSII